MSGRSVRYRIEGLVINESRKTIKAIASLFDFSNTLVTKRKKRNTAVIFFASFFHLGKNEDKRNLPPQTPYTTLRLSICKQNVVENGYTV